MKEKHSMRKSMILIIVSVIILSILIFSYLNLNNNSKDNQSNIRAKIESILPENWTISNITENTYPEGYEGQNNCINFLLEDPTVIYYDEFGDFNYTSFYQLWFCPSDWNGSEIDYSHPAAQEYHAQLLSVSEYKIYYLTFGNNTAPNLLDDIVDVFSS